jgi:hypothetical protein
MDATTQQDNRRLIRMSDEILDDGDAAAEARIAGARSHTIDGSDFDVSPPARSQSNGANIPAAWPVPDYRPPLRRYVAS